jgi:alkylated DNA repair dioxygenase AlkB
MASDLQYPLTAHPVAEVSGHQDEPREGKATLTIVLSMATSRTLIHRTNKIRHLREPVDPFPASRREA